MKDEANGTGGGGNVVDLWGLTAHDPEAAVGALRFKPYADFMQIEWHEPKMVGLIHLPQRMQEAIPGRAQGLGSLDWRRATVLKVGPECKFAEVGDVIVMAPEARIPVVIDGEKYHFAKESTILAVVEKAT